MIASKALRLGRSCRGDPWASARADEGETETETESESETETESESETETESESESELEDRVGSTTWRERSDSDRRTTIRPSA